MTSQLHEQRHTAGSTTGFHDRITAEEASKFCQRILQHDVMSSASSAFLVHDLRRMRNRIQAVRDAFPPGALHAVAIKANPVVEILREIVLCGAGLEAASLEEVHLALAAGCPVDKIVFDSPVKTPAEIREALALGIMLNANCLAELRRIDDSLRSQVSDSIIGLRINTEVGEGVIATTSVAGKGSKFGVSIGRHRKEILNAFRCYRWLRGLHAHVGSQGCGTNILAQSATRLSELAVQIERETNRRVKVLDIGGGLPARYDDLEADSVHAYALRLRQHAPSAFASDKQIVTEFGRAIHAECGLAFSRVEYARDQPALCFIHLGADFLLRPVYRPDEWQHEFFLLGPDGKVKTGDTSLTTLAGPLCFGGDIIARDISLPSVQPGDWIVIRDVGAYTLSMWSRHCSRGIPAVIGFDQEATDEIRMLRQPENPQDLVRFWSL